VGEADLAAAIVSETAGFEDGGCAYGVEGEVEIAKAVDRGVGCGGYAVEAEEIFFEETVLRDADGLRLRREVGEIGEYAGFDVLAFDGEGVDAVVEGAYGGGIFEVDGEDGSGLLCAVAGAAGAHDVDVELLRGLGEHEG
jgi:hypothetical protein